MLAPLRLDDLGVGAGVIGAAFLGAAALESGVSPVVGRVSDRRGRLFPCLIALAAGAGLMLLFPLPETAVAARAPGPARRADRRHAVGAVDGDALRRRRGAGDRTGLRVRALEPGLVDRLHDRARRSAPGWRTPRATPCRTCCCARSAAPRSSFLVRVRPRDSSSHDPVLARSAGARAAPAARRPRGGRPASWSAAASPGCGPRCRRRRRPGTRVVLLEGERLAFGASGRNGGFCEASLTHGLGNGLARWPDEMDALERLGLREPRRRSGRRSSATASTAASSETGEIAVATARAPAAEWLAEEAELLAPLGHDARAARPRPRCGREVDSPTYLGGLWDARRHARSSTRPRLCCGPRATPRRGRRADLTSARRSRALDARRRRRRGADTPGGRVLGARRAAGHQRVPAAGAARSAATSCRSTTTCWSPSRCRRRSARRSAGAAARGSPTSTNQFHYFRLTADDRILWGGYDAVYHFARPASARSSTSGRRPSTRLAEHFFDDVPAARGPALHAPLGRRDRHLQPLLAVLRAARSAAARPTSSASPAWASGATPLRRPRRARPARRRATRSARGCEMVRATAAAVPARAAARWAGIQLTQRALARADRSARAGAACGCARSTGSGSGSTPDQQAARATGPAAADAQTRCPPMTRTRAAATRGAKFAPATATGLTRIGAPASVARACTW